MKQIYPDLWKTPLEYRFGTLKTHAYLLEHKTGRNLIYVAEEPETHDAINKLGGVDRIYLSHNHEVTGGSEYALDWIGGSDVLPMFGWEVVEGQQHVAILGQLASIPWLRHSSNLSRQSWSGATVGKPDDKRKVQYSNTSTGFITRVGVIHPSVGKAPWHSKERPPK